MANFTFPRFILYLLAASLPGFLQAAELLVPEEHSTIQSAINAASSGDTVSVAPGTYPLATPLDFTGKAITVVGRNGAAETILRASGQNSLVLMVGVAGPQGRLEGFTLRDGTPEIVQRGGCVSIEGGSPIIANNRFENCRTIEGNEGSSGGAIKVISNATPIISGNTFTGNRSFSQGGAVHILQAGGTVRDNIFEDNHVSGQPESGGGGLKITFSTGNPVLVSGNVFRNNVASFAGSAISVFGGDAHIIDNEIISNGPSRFGGGIHLETQTNSGGNREFIVRGNLLENNSVTDTPVVGLEFDAVSGGGMHINPGPQGAITDSIVDIRDNVFIGNSALDSRCTNGSGTESCGNGGAIEFLNALQQPQIVAGNVFQANVADRYAAANFNSVQLEFSDNLVIGNRARRIHPGIGCVAGSAANASTCRINRNRFIDNAYANNGSGSGQQNDAGAVNIRRSTVEFINNLVANNHGHFGSVFVRHEDIPGAFSRIDHNTFAGNISTSANFGTLAMRGDAAIRNNIFQGDTRGFRLDNFSSASAVTKNNLTDTTSGVARLENDNIATVEALNDRTVASGNTALTPGFNAAGEGDFSLQPNSPLVDAVECIADITTDIREFPRPSGQACDTGAYEFGDDLIFADGFE